MNPLTNPRMIAASLLLTICASTPAFATAAPTSSRPSVGSSLAPQFERGSLVRLRSGGPMMTVFAVNGDQVKCIWTDYNGQPSDASFPADVLQKF